MAKIDDVAAQVAGLTEAVRGFMTRQADIIAQLNAELEALRADDEVENSKLEGISGVVQSLTDEVNAFGQNTTVPVDPANPDAGEEPINDEPVVPPGVNGDDEEEPDEEPVS